MVLRINDNYYENYEKEVNIIYWMLNKNQFPIESKSNIFQITFLKKNKKNLFVLKKYIIYCLLFTNWLQGNLNQPICVFKKKSIADKSIFLPKFFI